MSDAVFIAYAAAPVIAGLLVGAVAQLWKRRVGFYWWFLTTAAGYIAAFGLDRILRSLDGYRQMVEAAAKESAPRLVTIEIAAGGILAGLVMLIGVSTLPRSNALKRSGEAG
ncbi:hypothetical protein [Dongia deserti]|uniref:hypothetical protein n=1 Tax=Dongia deserti TaxID=2268030 RepID=UPI000E64F7F7|nr:hypothetical protein [Dongia deserti]